MKTVGAFEAKTKLSELLREVENMHEEIIIRKRNRNIARLIPYENYSSSEELKIDIVKGFRDIRKSQKPLECSLKELIDEGRKR